MYPRNDLSYAGNFLRMMFGTPCEDYKVNPVLERAHGPDLHPARRPRAERLHLHRAPVRLARARTRSPAIAAGVACLWGPAHGGANEACLNMLEDIQRNGGVAKVGEFMEQVKDKNCGVKLMGFGHRVYKNYDPRAKLMQETCNEVLAELGLENDPLFKLAKQLEKIALEDDYFVSRKLYPNVDFYSGIVQRAIGIPVSLFTGIFALARTVGWIAQLQRNDRPTPSTRSAVRASCSPARRAATLSHPRPPDHKARRHSACGLCALWASPRLPWRAPAYLPKEPPPP